MDTSLSKALIMVASVLLAMIVIAFITFSFGRIGMWATTSDDELLKEQKDKFNKEYEVYDKDLMYGVDVISCLNKALSNNDKIKEKKYVTGDMLDRSYEIQVKVGLKSKELKESIEVYYMPDSISSFSKKEEYSYANNEGISDVDLEKAGFKFINNENYKNLSSFDKMTKLKTNTNSKVNLETTELLLTKDSTDSDKIIQLLEASNTISEIVKNKDPETKSKGKGEGWTKAEFKSALYDLKTRKFKCVEIKYSEAGRVNYIEFKEI